MTHFYKKNLIEFIHNSRFSNTPKSRFITHYLSLFLVMLIIPVFCITFLPGQILAKEDIVRRDTDEDGKIDQIAFFDKRSKLIRLESDSNADEIMDRFQYYEDEQIKRVERDTNYDQKIDIRDYFEAGKRIRHERASTDTGRLNQIIQFDSEERPLKIQKDTSADGQFDSIYYFEQGKLSRSTKDTDGEPVEQQKDANADDRFDIITWFKNGKPHYQEKDTNFDEKKDVFVYFDAKDLLKRLKKTQAHQR